MQHQSWSQGGSAQSSPVCGSWGLPGDAVAELTAVWTEDIWDSAVLPMLDLWSARAASSNRCGVGCGLPSRPQRISWSGPEHSPIWYDSPCFPEHFCVASLLGRWQHQPRSALPWHLCRSGAFLRLLFPLLAPPGLSLLPRTFHCLRMLAHTWYTCGRR